jgi:hypothetical protein
MKNLISLFAAAVILLGSTGYSQEANPLVGSWELLSHRLVSPDTTVVADMSTLRSIKILSHTHFAYVSTTKTQDTTIVGAGAGTYSFNDKKYIETLEQSSYPVMVGKVYDFTHLVEGDTWTHIGDLEDFNVRIEEVWRRLK